MAGAGDSGEARWRVFVSHTSELRDFPARGSYVAAVERAVSTCGHVIVDMAGFPAADQSAADLCRERVRSCDVYVGVLGARYGSVVPDMPRVSYTELEFDTATEAGLPRLVFVLDTDAAQAGIPLSRLIDLESGARQEEFRRRVQASLVTQQFADPGTLGQLVERSLRELAPLRARTAARSAGRLLAAVTDPFALEVHRPVQPGDRRPGLPGLPEYVAREHDRELAVVVRAAADGTSRIAVLVGGSSTGKTRACWEALHPLRDQPGPWRLWHPIDPSRPEAALRDLGTIGPRTVLWLNEAQFYLDAPAGGLGEQVAAGLRELLRDPARAPVLVLATLWPQFWATLTARPAAGEDPHAQARELLAGRDIGVPAAFTPDQVRQLAGSADPRLALAAAAADGQVVQFLAGAPELLARYEYAPPPAKALISAAIDARRLGMGIALPVAFLEAAAPGYLTGTDWDTLSEDWLDQALAYTAAPCNGVRGPLTRIRPRPAGTAAGPGCRLADYLDQHGRRARRAVIPPAEFWDAAARFASLSELPAVAKAAETRGLLRDAARIRKHAAARGNAMAALHLVRALHDLHPADHHPARWVAAHAALDDPAIVIFLLHELQQVGADEQAAALAARAAAHAALGHPGAVAWLLDALRRAGADEQAAVLLARDPARHAALDDPRAVTELLDALRRAGADEQVTVLAARAAGHAAVGNPYAVTELLDALRRAGAQDQADVLAARAAGHAALGDPRAVAGLLDVLRRVGRPEQVTVLAARAAGHAALDDLYAVADLLGMLRRVGGPEQVTVLAARAAGHAAIHDPGAIDGLLDALRRAGADEHAALLLARDPAGHAALGDPGAVARLLGILRLTHQAGAAEQVTALLARDPGGHAALGDPGAVAWLLDELRRAGAQEQAAVLAARAARHAAVGDPGAVARLLYELPQAGAQEQAAVLVARDPAGHAALGDLYAVGHLLAALQRAGAQEQAAVLAARAAGHAAVDDPYAVTDLLGMLQRAGADEQAAVLAARAAGHAALDYRDAATRLLDELRRAGAEEQVSILIDRLPAAGLFDLFREQDCHQVIYQFGREPDGTPAPSWGWDDLN